MQRPAICHPDRPHHSHGLCGACAATKRTRLRRARERAPRGPDEGAARTSKLHAGHELSGVSTLVDRQTGDELQAWEKTRLHGAEEAPHDPQPPGFLVDRVSTFRRGDGTTVGQWVSASPEKVEQWLAKQAAIEAFFAGVKDAAAPVTPPPPLLGSDDLRKLLANYNLGDPHIGMLAWAKEVGASFDLKIAEAELTECMRQLVGRAPPTERAVVTNLGDFWHAQNAEQRTPRGGNKLDVDGRKGKTGEVGLKILQAILDAALAKHARVDFFSLPGNHDPDEAFWLPAWARAWYRNEPRLTVHDGFAPRQYLEWGANLLGWCHGDGAKWNELPNLMAVEQREAWGRTRYQFWNCGHVHHWSQKEHGGVYIDTHRTMAGKDAWHHAKGYRAGQALKVNMYHEEWGFDGSLVVGVERVREALRRAA
jgi:hypothetical protein